MGAVVKLKPAESGRNSPVVRSSARYNRRVPKVTFLPANVTVEFEHGRLTFQDHGLPESVLDVALNFGVDLKHACGGNCACTTCHVIVKERADNLSEMDEDEADRLDMAAGLTLHSRLGCQCVVKGDVVVEIPSWSRHSEWQAGNSPDPPWRRKADG